MKLSEKLQHLFENMGTEDNITLQIVNEQGEKGESVTIDITDVVSLLAGTKMQETYDTVVGSYLMKTFEKEETCLEKTK